MQRRFSIKNIVALGALLVLAWLGYKMFPGSSKPPEVKLLHHPGKAGGYWPIAIVIGSCQTITHVEGNQLRGGQN